MPMQPLTVMYGRIFSSVNRSLLNLTFMHNEEGDQYPTLDEAIKEVIIKGRVLPEINTTCGREARIPLLSSYVETTDALRLKYLGPNLMGDLYRIPPEAREGRDIVAVRSVHHAFAYTHTDGMSPMVFGDSGNNLNNMMGALTASHTLANGNITPRPTLMEGNIIRIAPRMLTEGTFLECILGYDEEFTNLPHGAINPLTNYVIAVIKGHIYNELAVKVDAGQLMGGMPITRVREFIDRYEQEGALAEQERLLEMFRGSSILNPESFRRYAQLAL